MEIREQVSDIDLELNINRWLTGYTGAVRRAKAQTMQHFLLSIDFTARLTKDGYIQIVRAYNVHMLFEDVTAFDEAMAKKKVMELISGVPPIGMNIIVEGVTPS